ncbi:hypothetical protein [Adhaeribacter pallidiroseus]|nr:hypothetical protein [Adhaeribacter pallidiroseus]
MKTTLIENQHSNTLLEELRQTAIEAFEKKALDSISLSSALRLTRRDDPSKPNPLSQDEILDLESRIKYLKGRIESASTYDLPNGKVPAAGTCRTIDLDENDLSDINIIYKPDKDRSPVIFNATPLLHAIVEETSPEEVAQAIDQSMEFMIGYLGYTGWHMNDNIAGIYATLRKVRNSIIAGYANCVLTPYID